MALLMNYVINMDDKTGDCRRGGNLPPAADTRQRNGVMSWCLYDWANSAFVLIVVTGFFPVFFKSYYSGGGVDVVKSTLWLGMGNTAAGIVIAVLSLFLGALADAGMGKKRFLGFFAATGALATAALFLVGRGEWVTALVLFILGNIGFSCANLFYDALLVDVADEKSMDFVSSLGFALGYIGSVMLFGVNIWMTVSPAMFGLADSAAAVKVSFLCVSIWWMVFSIPLFLFVKERKRAAQTPSARTSSVQTSSVQTSSVQTSSVQTSSVQTLQTPVPSTQKQSVRNTIATIKKTFKAIVKNQPLLLFLCAYWLYFDGINTFIRMAVDFGLSLGFGQNSLMIALVVVQIIAFPSSLVFGYLSAKVGTQRMITIGVVIYIAISVYGSLFMRTEVQFIVLAALTGLAQGGIQALSRSYFGKLIPADESTEYFGFYNVVSRFAVVGPIIIGLVAMAARGMGAEGALASRVGMSSVNLFFIGGLILLLMAERVRLRSAAE